MTILDSDAIIVVDVQNDFFHGGALPVPLAEHVVTPLNRAIVRFGTVVLTRDWHPTDHCSFADPPAFQDGSWPMHCVQDSPGAEFHGDLRTPLDALVVSKGTDAEREAYSGFEGTDLAARLRARGVQRVFVGGLALDFCVRATALDALRAGFVTFLLSDATRAAQEEATPAIIEELAEKGVQIASAGELE